MPIPDTAKDKFHPAAFFENRSGATAIEYGLICAGIGLLILAALNTTGEALVAKLTYLLNLLS